jgi:transcriptional regulator with XRE-family HTH domain
MAEHKTLTDHARTLKEAQGERLRRLRVVLGVRQADAARLTGLTPFKWNHMEAGRHPIDPLALQMFCDAHGTGADYVITAKKATLRADLLDKIVLQESEDRKPKPVDLSPRRGRKPSAANRDRVEHPQDSMNPLPEAAAA